FTARTRRTSICSTVINERMPWCRLHPRNSNAGEMNRRINSCRATYSCIDKIRSELAWVNETPDPNKCGCRNVRCCEETGHKPGACPGQLQRSSGRSDGCTTVRHAASMDGAALRQSTT